jgi:O-antigen/teichoic acid export membrane protein
MRPKRPLASLRNPIYLSGYALVANTAGSTAVGLIYWVVAAHFYSREIVGQASALVAALVLVSSFSQLNLANTFPRFLPQAGRRAKRFIGYGYVLSSAVAAVIGIGFVAIMPHLSSQWRFLSQSSMLSIGFAIASVVWTVFALQDAVLIGLQKSVVVPVENTAYGVAKLLLLLSIASLLSSAGIFVSWIVPLVVLVPVINWLIFVRYLPRRESAMAVATVGPREVVKFTAMDYVGGLLGQAYGSLLPLLVLSLLGAAANASFYVTWTISNGLALVATNFATSLLVEGAVTPGRLGLLTRGVLVRCLLVTGGGAALVALLAKPILSIYGNGYAAHATVLLCLLAAGSVLYGVVAIVMSLDRLAGRVGQLALTRVVLAILVLGGSWVALRRYGIDGAGSVWLGANLLVATARGRTILAVIRVRADQATQSRAASGSAAPHGLPAAAIRRGQHRRPRAGRHESR